MSNAGFMPTKISRVSAVFRVPQRGIFCRLHTCGENISPEFFWPYPNYFQKHDGKELTIRFLIFGISCQSFINLGLIFCSHDFNTQGNKMILKKFLSLLLICLSGAVAQTPASTTEGCDTTDHNLRLDYNYFNQTMRGMGLPRNPTKEEIYCFLNTQDRPALMKRMVAAAQAQAQAQAQKQSSAPAVMPTPELPTITPPTAQERQPIPFTTLIFDIKRIGDKDALVVDYNFLKQHNHRTTGFSVLGIEGGDFIISNIAKGIAYEGIKCTDPNGCRIQLSGAEGNIFVYTIQGQYEFVQQDSDVPFTTLQFDIKDLDGKSTLVSRINEETFWLNLPQKTVDEVLRNIQNNIFYQGISCADPNGCSLKISSRQGTNIIYDIIGRTRFVMQQPSQAPGSDPSEPPAQLLLPPGTYDLSKTEVFNAFGLNGSDQKFGKYIGILVETPQGQLAVNPKQMRDLGTTIPMVTCSQPQGCPLQFKKVLEGSTVPLYVIIDEHQFGSRKPGDPSIAPVPAGGSSPIAPLDTNIKVPYAWAVPVDKIDDSRVLNLKNPAVSFVLDKSSITKVTALLTQNPQLKGFLYCPEPSGCEATLQRDIGTSTKPMKEFKAKDLSIGAGKKITKPMTLKLNSRGDFINLQNEQTGEEYLINLILLNDGPVKSALKEGNTYTVTPDATDGADHVALTNESVDFKGQKVWNYMVRGGKFKIEEAASAGNASATKTEFPFQMIKNDVKDVLGEKRATVLLDSKNALRLPSATFSPINLPPEDTKKLLTPEFKGIACDDPNGCKLVLEKTISNVDYYDIVGKYVLVPKLPDIPEDKKSMTIENGASFEIFKIADGIISSVGKSDRAFILDDDHKNQLASFSTSKDPMYFQCLDANVCTFTYSKVVTGPLINDRYGYDISGAYEITKAPLPPQGSKAPESSAPTNNSLPVLQGWAIPITKISDKIVAHGTVNSVAFALNNANSTMLANALNNNTYRTTYLMCMSVKGCTANPAPDLDSQGAGRKVYQFSSDNVTYVLPGKPLSVDLNLEYLERKDDAGGYFFKDDATSKKTLIPFSALKNGMAFAAGKIYKISCASGESCITTHLSLDNGATQTNGINVLLGKFDVVLGDNTTAEYNQLSNNEYKNNLLIGKITESQVKQAINSSEYQNVKKLISQNTNQDSLNLANKGLTLVPSLGVLGQTIVTLNLSKNKLIALPESFQNMPKLNKLDISNNPNLFSSAIDDRTKTIIYYYSKGANGAQKALIIDENQYNSAKQWFNGFTNLDIHVVPEDPGLNVIAGASSINAAKTMQSARKLIDLRLTQISFPVDQDPYYKFVFYSYYLGGNVHVKADQNCKTGCSLSDKNFYANIVFNLIDKKSYRFSVTCRPTNSTTCSITPITGSPNHYNFSAGYELSYEKIY